MSIHKKTALYLLLCFLYSFNLFAQEKKIISVETAVRKLPFGLAEKINKNRPLVGIVLSGGGSRGISQIGVLKALQENNIPIDIIVGTSMGSIVGGLYASGYTLDEMDSLLKAADWPSLLALGEEASRKELFVDQKITEDNEIFALRLDGLKPILPTSLNSGQRLSNFLNLLTLNAPIHVAKSFDELYYKFRAVSTDFITGESVILEGGSLSQALRASSSFSPILSPVRIDSMVLVDGGLSANIPVEVATKLGGDFIIAVNTTTPLYTRDDLSNPIKVADQIVSIPMSKLSMQQLEKSDVVISPALKDITNISFSSETVDTVIHIGYMKAMEQMDDIKDKINRCFDSTTAYDISYRNDDLALNGPAMPDSYTVFEHLADTLSDRKIMRYLGELYETGNYDTLFAEVITDTSANSGVLIKGLYNPIVRDVFISGVSLVDKSKIDSIGALLKGKPYNAKIAVRRLIDMLKLYRKAGYSLAVIESASFDKGSGMLSASISEGLIYDVEVDGYEKTQPSVIRREFPLKKGNYFKLEGAEKGLANLRSTGLFDDVNVSVRKTPYGDIVRVTVQERPSAIMRMGIRGDNERQIQLSLDIRDENVYGSATELGYTIAGGSKNFSTIVEHRANRIFSTYLTYKIRGFYEYEDIATYTYDTTSSNELDRVQNGSYKQSFFGFSLGLGAQMERFGNVILEGRFQNDRIKDKGGNAENEMDLNIFSLKVSSTIDSRDQYPFAESGFFVKSFYETASSTLGGQIGYTKFMFDYASYFSFLKYHTVTPRFVLGSADETLPLSRQFSLGGQHNFYGLREYERRGRQLLVGSLEYRFKSPIPLFFDTYLSARYDLGSVWANREQIRFKDLRHGAGLALSFSTPIGPAEFAVGKSFNFAGKVSDANIKYGQTVAYFSFGYYLDH